MKSILIIEDNPIFQIRLKNIVEAERYEPLLVSSMKEAQDLLKSQEFDLLICNIVLGDGNIFDMECFPDIPIIFVTADERIDYMEAALEIPDAQFFVKPFSDLTLRAAIRQATLNCQQPEEYITVFGKHKNPIKIPVDKIEFVESEGNYSYIVTTNNVKYVIKRSAKQLMSNVSEAVFLRIKRATFVNKSKLIRISLATNKVFTKNHELLVSKNFKKNIYEFHHLDK